LELENRIAMAPPSASDVDAEDRRYTQIADEAEHAATVLSERLTGLKTMPGGAGE
jgi:hypothetical protein